MPAHTFPISTLAPVWSLRDTLRPPELGRKEVHVWATDLDGQEWRSARFLSLLSSAELERFHSFAHPRDASAFLGRRAFLRVILAGYTGGDPRALLFAQRCANCGSTAHGKPYLAAGCGHPVLEFSLSCSKRDVLVAVTRGGPLGVDVERHARALPLESLLGYASSPEERRAVDESPATERTSRFLLLWALKEAYLKGLGLGLSRHPADLSIAFSGDRPQRLRDTVATGAGADWQLGAARTDRCLMALAYPADRSVRWLRAGSPTGPSL